MRSAPFVILVLAGLVPVAAAQTPLTTSRVASGLAKPLWVGSAPGDDRLFVVEQTQADIHIIENGLPKLPPFLDLTTAKVMTTFSEQGLLGMAFDPGYASNGFFYVFYTRAGDGAEIVERYHTLDPNTADPASGVIILGPVTDPQSNHNGGNIVFGADGKLYVGIGDGGNFNDSGPGHVAGGNAQFGGTLMGKMLRLNADGTVPGDNPFISPTDGFMDQIWMYGVRNPWRWSFDRLTGDFWLGDVGQDLIEEIDFHAAGDPAGKNFGWRCMEGFSCTGLSGCTCNAPALTQPIWDYSHVGGNCSVTGGFVYRGPSIPSLQGTYFFTDYCTATLWTMTWNGVAVQDFTNRTVELAPGVGQTINFVTSYGEDNDGELYIVDQGGEIFRVVADPFSSLGGPLPGLTGNPILAGEGGLLGGSLNQLRLSNARASSPTALFTSIGVGAAPFKGGILQAFPFVSLVSGATSAVGTLDLPFTFPTGVSPGLQLVFQYAIKDAAAVQQVALSNALSAITP